MNQDQYILVIWKLYAKLHNQYCRDYLCDYYYYLVMQHAESKCIQLETSIGSDTEIDVDSLTQAGVQGLLKAIDAYDPLEDIPFEEHVKPFIYDAFNDYFHNTVIWANVNHRNRPEPPIDAPKYTEAQLFVIAFARANSIFFQTVDSDGNPRELFKDFDESHLTDKELRLFNEYYSWSWKDCEEIFYEET